MGKKRLPIVDLSVDCSYCRSPCCQLVVELTDEEAHKYVNKVVVLGGNQVTILDRKEDGYCVYHVKGKGCSIYENRPFVCGAYNCKRDRRITSSLKYGPTKSWVELP